MTSQDQAMPHFLAGGGEMGAHIRAYPWIESAMGAPVSWPQSLKTAVRLLLSTQHPMFIWWGPSLIQFYNDAYRQSIGPERHPSALGQGGRQCWEEIWPIIGPQIEQVLRGEGSIWQQNALVPITRNGAREEVYWTYSYSPIDDPEAVAGVGGVLVVCSETTTEVLAARHEAAQREHLAGLFEQAPSFMAVLRGPQHRFELANPKYMNLIGHRPVLGKTVAEALPETQAQGYLALLDQVFESGVAFQATGSTYSTQTTAGGPLDERFVDFVLQPIKDAEGTTSGIFVVGVDVTARAVAEQELRKADRRKDEFLAMLAHELRNPLAPISTAAEMLAMQDIGEDDIRSIGEVIARQVSHMTSLVGDLLDMSRVTRGLVVLAREPLDLQTVVATAVEQVRPLIDARRHALTVRPAGMPVVVRGDGVRLVQIVANLLSNAAKYTPQGGEILLSVAVHDRHASLVVRDNGPGIDPDLLPRVFELFAQGERTPDRSQGGLGLGLALVRSLAELHGGSVHAHSDGIGCGSTFTVVLPYFSGDAQTPAPSEKAPSPSRVTPLRVMLVDDNVDAASGLATLLRFAGHRVCVMHDGKTALEADGLHEQQAFILDIGLPGMDGHELARRLRGRPETAGTVLIALTGYGREHDRALSRAAGFDHHFVKPVDAAALARVFASIA